MRTHASKLPLVAAVFMLSSPRHDGAPNAWSKRDTSLADSTTAWAFAVEQRYGDRPGSELVNPTTLAVDGAGRLYVADAKPVVIKVFNPDGTLLRTIGREGGGPGEFRVAWIAVRGSHLVVHDPGQSRTSVFDTSGAYLRSWRSFCCHGAEIAIDNSNRIAVPATVQFGNDGSGVHRIPYARYRLDGTLIDTLLIRTTGSERLWTVTREGGAGGKVGGTAIIVPFSPLRVAPGRWIRHRLVRIVQRRALRDREGLHATCLAPLDTVPDS